MTHNIPYSIAHQHAEEVQKRINAFGFSSVECYIQQAPHADNGHLAIAHTTLVRGNFSYSMPGFASPETSNTDKAHLLTNEAMTASMNNALRGFEGRPAPAPSSPHERPASTALRALGERRPSSTKPISSKQEDYIRGLVSRSGGNVDQVAKDLTGKPLAQCNAADADKIIKHLKPAPAGKNSP